MPRRYTKFPAAIATGIRPQRTVHDFNGELVLCLASRLVIVSDHANAPETHHKSQREEAFGRLNNSDAVNEFMRALDHPLKPALEAVRGAITSDIT